MDLKYTNIRNNNFTDSSNIDDKRISLFIIVFYLSQILNTTIKTILPIPQSLYPTISIMFGLIIILFFIRGASPVLKRSLVPFIFIEFLCIGIFSISYLMGNAEISLLFENAIWALCLCTPLIIYSYSIKNNNILYNLFLKNTFIMDIILVMLYIFSPNGSYYNMSFSYALLIPVLFHINEWFNSGKKTLLLLFSIEILGILLYGARGPLLSIISFFLIKFVLSKVGLIKKNGIISLILIIGVTIFFYFEKIGMYVLKILSEKGYYSRTLSILFTDKITYGSGRIEIFKYYINLAYERPILGWGVLGGWMNKGLGPHNMLIEVLLAFGFIIGGIIIILLLLSQLRVFFVKDEATRDLLMIYMSSCIVLFFVSGNIFQKPELFIFLGLVLGSFKNK